MMGSPPVARPRKSVKEGEPMHLDRLPLGQLPRKTNSSSKYEMKDESSISGSSKHSRARSRRSSMHPSKPTDPFAKMIVKLTGHHSEIDEQDLEPDHSLPVRLFFKLILLPVLHALSMLAKWSYDGLVLLAIQTLSGYWSIFALPLQIAFQNPVSFDLLYIIGYGFDVILNGIKMYPIYTKARLLLCTVRGNDSSAASFKSFRKTTGSVRNSGNIRTGATVVPESSIQRDGRGSGRLKVDGRTSGRLSIDGRGSTRRFSVKSGASAAQNAAALARIAQDKRRRRARQRKALCKGICWDVLALIPYFPFDVFFWGGSLQWFVPYVRLSRLLYAPTYINKFHTSIEASQITSFNVSRYFRVGVVFAICSHWLGCLLFYVSERSVASHYDAAPWVVGAEHNKSTAIDTVYYLWASYYSVMSLTANHVNIVESVGREWEVTVAIIVVIGSTLCFMYMNSNITSLIMRHTQVLENYRLRLSQVDGYLKRNQVSKEVRRSVKRHFRMNMDDSQAKDQALLEQMPHTLKRQVLYDIHMRTMRRVPIFFGCEPMMLHHLCNVMKRMVVLPDVLLCTQGDVMTEMYFLEEGSLATYEEEDEVDDDESTEDEVDDMDDIIEIESEMQANNNTELSAEPSKGAHFELSAQPAAEAMAFGEDFKTVETPGAPIAEVAFIFGMRQDLTVEALKMSTCLVINKADYTDILKDFPESVDSIRANIKERLKQMQRFEVLEAIEKAEGKPKEHIATLADMLFACATGDVQTVRKAINETGISIAETDYEGRSCLHIAASAGQQAVVQCLLEANISVNKQDATGKTALENALFRGHIEIVKLLRSRGAVLGWDTFKEGYYLCDAIRLSKLPTVELLLDCGVSPNSPSFDSRCALHQAAAEGNAKAVEILLARRAHVNPQDRWGCTPLRDAVRGAHTKVAVMLKKAGGHMALSEADAASELCQQVKNSDQQGVKLLLDCGLDANSADYDGRTPLHLAASLGNMSLVTFLIKRNAKVDVVDRWGGTPLRDAVREAHKEVASYIRMAGGTLGFDECTASGELCEMARQGNTPVLAMLLECGALVNAADYDKRTCLHLAASEGNLPVCQLLISKNSNVNAKDRWGGTPLRDAVREGHKSVAVLLREQGGELGYDDVQTSGELCELARNGSLDLLSVMLSCGVNVNAMDYDNRTCLHLAASVGSIPIVELLLENKANINCTDRWDGTPLVDSIRHGHIELAKLLFKKGGQLGYTEVQASGELCELARQGCLDSLKTLVDCGACVNACDYDKRTCLHLAASEGSMSLVSVLIDLKADLNFKDRWGGTPLRDALRHGHLKVAELLHEKGGLLGFNEVETAGELCELAKNGSTDNIRSLLKCGASPNSADYDKRTCLHLAAGEGALHIVSTLIDAKADINPVDRWGNTPLQDAIRNGHEDVMELLLKSGGKLMTPQPLLAHQMCTLAREGRPDPIIQMLKSGADANVADYDKRTPLHVAASEGHIAVVKALLRFKAASDAADRWGNTPQSEAARNGHNWSSSTWVS
ncbi:hypothetical protein AB1Y20_021525 [Prymnesium parvum]|uniref:Cyclic nucleotide-binding domain-containing protein n=1 Tax=Prymnesium parvum TaxID=97485 RepID=A0AB34JMH2_PRYPA